MKRKYNNDEQRRLARIQTAKKYYQEHKNDEEFKEKRKYWRKNYMKNLQEHKKSIYKKYNTDYIFYKRNIITGKFKEKILNKKHKIEELREQVLKMEERLMDLTLKFQHLNNKK